MPKHEEKICPGCQARFECKVGNITLCQCSTVTLNIEEKTFLCEQYDDCLCANCMLTLKKEYHREQKIQASETRIFKVVFPNTTNHYDTLFGGTAMQLMDEVAFITATRFSRKRLVTVSSSKIDFSKAIPADTIIEIIGRVIKVGKTSVDVKIVVYGEEMYKQGREQAIKGTFTFVAIDEHKKPTLVE